MILQVKDYLLVSIITFDYSICGIGFVLSEPHKLDGKELKTDGREIENIFKEEEENIKEK